ncbi:MAG: hypothetical protein OXF79_03895 [Chloroflexi bacterium]|nr:hypothetical protein [Chloroflexota bacterium]
MIANISVHKRAMRPLAAKRSLLASTVPSLVRNVAGWIALRLSGQTTDPFFVRGLGDDFTAEVAQALTVAHRSEWDGSKNSAPAGA